jgi:benzoyl-CoA reductase/2-hydroxyglutaryl-CoA dehydratase subunit BcrC/BadD/HgdB
MIRGSERDSKHLAIHEMDVISTIDRLKTFQDSRYDITYFLDTAMKFSFNRQYHKNTYTISIMGLTFPEEIIYAFGAKPLWMLGGSFGSAMYADKFVPRDTDSVSKSSLGYMRAGLFPFFEKSDLLVVPVSSDSMRKIAHMLSKEIEVFPIDIPPVKDDTYSKKKWMSQINALISVLEKKTKIRLTKDRLLAAGNLVNAAKHEMKRLLHYCMVNPNFMPGALVMFIINTYYLTQDINEWTLKLRALNNKVNTSSSHKYKNANIYLSSVEKPKILVAGSPIYFPNFKIPLLLSELNVDVAAYANEMTRRVYSESNLTNKRVSLSGLVEKIAWTNYLEASSSAFVDDKSGLQYIMTLSKNIPLDGVIYHVLKGQIYQDFELEKIESFFSSKNIPFFRLETDYNHQDIEQLRIRTEAFVEMISVKYARPFETNYGIMRA